MQAERIKFTDSFQEVIIKMSEGNPGCLAFLMELVKYREIKAMSDILLFDNMRVYGSKLYIFWNDCCDRNMEKASLVMDKLKKGEMEKQIFLNHIDGVRGIPFEF